MITLIGEYIIIALQSVTQWTDRQLVIDYLQAFEWDIDVGLLH